MMLKYPLKVSQKPGETQLAFQQASICRACVSNGEPDVNEQSQEVDHHASA
jgi:hypothetical protein